MTTLSFIMHTMTCLWVPKPFQMIHNCVPIWLAGDTLRRAACRPKGGRVGDPTDPTQARCPSYPTRRRPQIDLAPPCGPLGWRPWSLTPGPWPGVPSWKDPILRQALPFDRFAFFGASSMFCSDTSVKPVDDVITRPKYLPDKQPLCRFRLSFRRWPSAIAARLSYGAFFIP